MKRILLPTVLALFILVGCSKDDGPKCDSCTVGGDKLEICDNGDGTYELKGGGETATISESDLGGLTPKEFVQSICVLGVLTL